MKISIVVPAFNEEKLLGSSLEAICGSMSAFIERRWETELIVCDNNSTDATAELATRHGAQVVFEPVNQIGRARNRGAGAASGDWLIFIDADSRPSRALFDDVATAISSGSCLAGGVTVKVEGSPSWAGKATWLWNMISRANRWMAGSFIFCEARAFREVGGFSEELFASEELDLSRRLKRLARKLGRQVVILNEHPLVTSDRKVHLYSKREVVTFMLRFLRSPRDTLRSREACAHWYDGRR